MSYLRGFARFWYDFVIGDDWKIAASVVTVLLLGVLLAAATALPAAAVSPLLGVLMLAGFAVVVMLDVR